MHLKEKKFAGQGLESTGIIYDSGQEEGGGDVVKQDLLRVEGGVQHLRQGLVGGKEKCMGHSLVEDGIQ